MTRKQYDLSKIDFDIKCTHTWEPVSKVRGSLGENLCFGGFVFVTIIFFSEKKRKVMVSELLNGDTITYSLPSGAQELRIKVNVDSLVKEKILDDKDGVYNVLIDIITKSKNIIPFSISIPEYEVTTFGDTERKYISPSAYDVMLQSLQLALGSDLALQIKLECDIPITFEDIENADNIELREQALRKFGYENYVKEGFEKNEIELIILKEGIISKDVVYPSINFPGGYCGYSQGISKEYTRELFRELNNAYLYKKEKIIKMRNDIAFLQVQDSSTDKTYFLKIPPSIIDIQEAKAWTFSLSKEQYKPLIEA